MKLFSIFTLHFQYIFTLVLQVIPDCQIIPYLPCYKKVLPHMFPRLLAHPPCHLRIVQYLSYSEGRTFNRVDKKTCTAMADLYGDSACGAAYYWFSLPHGLGHSEAKSLFNGFLKYNSGNTLQGVYFPVTEWRQH